MKTIPQTIAEERDRWIKPIIEKEVRIKHMIVGILF